MELGSVFDSFKRGTIHLGFVGQISRIQPCVLDVWTHVLRRCIRCRMVVVMKASRVKQ